jgi:hypothetical protein
VKEFKGNFGNKGKKKMGVLYVGFRNGKFGWYDEESEGVISGYNFDFGKYEGEIKNGKSNGQGTLFYWKRKNKKYRKKYIGEFKDGKRIQGTLISPDGEKYIGEFKDDKPRNIHLR